MAVGAASLEALCASADTALGSTSEGPAPARPISDRRERSQARRRGGSGLKRWSVASMWDCSRQPAEHVV